MGLSLKVLLGALNSIQAAYSDPCDRLLQLIYSGALEVHRTQTDIVDALKRLLVYWANLAKRIEAKNCPPALQDTDRGKTRNLMCTSRVSISILT